MKLKTMLIAGAIAMAASGVSAKNYVVDLGEPSSAGTYAAGFKSSIKTSGAFEDTFSFTPIEKGWAQGSLITVSTNPRDVIQFKGATLNGKQFEFESLGAGSYGFTPTDFFTGPLILKVWGIAAPAIAAGKNIAASYSGTISVSAVPEPETYAMMLAGLGLFGAIARRNSKKDQAESELTPA